MSTLRGLYHIKHILRFFSTLLAVSIAFSAVLIQASAEEKFETLRIKQFDILPTIDGVISGGEWGEMLVDASVDTNACCYSNTSTPETHFQVWMGYTFEGIYIAISNKDDFHTNSATVTGSERMYNGDYMLFMMDEMGCTADQGLPPTTSRIENWSEKRSEIGVALGDDGNEYSYCWRGVSKGNSIDDGEYSIKNGNGYTVYEIFMPWERVSYEAPHVGSTYGMSIGTINYGDKDGMNYMEWGTGVFNFPNRGGERIYGSNRIVYTDETMFGGEPLTDPNPGDPYIPIVPPDAEGSSIDFSLSEFANTYSMDWVYYQDTDSAKVQYIGYDPHIEYVLSKKFNANADEYKYLAIYCKTNTGNIPGRIYFTTEKNPMFSQEGSVDFWFSNSENKQIAVVDLSANELWDGKIGKLRFDIVDPIEYDQISNIEELYTEIYGVALFKTYNEAKMFIRADENIPEFVLGDCNGDGIINSKDILLIKMQMNGQAEIDSMIPDINQDGNSDATDIRGIADIIKNADPGHTHSWSEWRDVKRVSCTEDGLQESVCTSCEKRYRKILSKGSHDMCMDNAVDATCVSVGCTQGAHCASCGEIILAQQEIPINPNAHDLVCIDAKDATCITPQMTSGMYCSLCDKVILAQTIVGDIDRNVHENIVIDEGFDYTCTKNGLTEGKHCSDCGAIIVPQQVLLAAHRYNEKTGICELCGER